MGKGSLWCSTGGAANLASSGKLGSQTSGVLQAVCRGGGMRRCRIRGCYKTTKAPDGLCDRCREELEALRDYYNFESAVEEAKSAKPAA